MLPLLNFTASLKTGKGFETVRTPNKAPGPPAGRAAETRNILILDLLCIIFVHKFCVRVILRNQIKPTLISEKSWNEKRV